MNKIWCLFFVCCFLIVGGCSFNDHSIGKKINLDEFQTMKIMNDWNYFVKDNVHYVVDEDNNPIFISYKTDIINNSLYFEDLEYIDFISSAVLSNGPIYGKALYSCKGETIERYYMNFSGSYSGKELDIEFVVWDTDVKEKTIKEIAKTFEAKS